MSYHAVIAFPDNDGATLEAVLSQTNIGGIVSSPMEDMLLICSSDADAAYIRCGLELRPATDKAFLVPVGNQLAVDSWMTLNGMAGRYLWATLEHFEFFRVGAVDQANESFRRIVGYDPTLLPLELWPDVFRPNVLAA